MNAFEEQGPDTWALISLWLFLMCKGGWGGGQMSELGAFISRLIGTWKCPETGGLPDTVAERQVKIDTGRSGEPPASV